MSVFKTSNIKKFLQIPENDYSLDELIEMLIPSAEMTVLHYTNNNVILKDVALEPYIAEFIGYKLSKEKNVKNFSLGDYSVTYKSELEALQIFKPFKKIKLL